MKTIEATAALDALNVIGNSGVSVPVKFAYAAVRNRRRIGDLVDVYVAKRLELLNEFGKKNEQGQLVIANGQYQLSQASEQFNAAMQELGDTEVEVTLHKVPIEEFPQGLSLSVMDALCAMVLEPEEVKA
jgi:hypothetical protein